MRSSFNSISQFGRILDPVADKAMQGVMLAYLVPRYPLAEACTDSVCGQRMLHDGYRMEGDSWKRETTIEPQWHGKLNTAVTYVVVTALDGGSETSVFDFQCTDWCMCRMYGDVA